MPEIYITRRSSWERTKGRKRLLVQITYLAFYLSIDPVHRQGSVYRRIRKIYITFKNTSLLPRRAEKNISNWIVSNRSKVGRRTGEKFWNFFSLYIRRFHSENRIPLSSRKFLAFFAIWQVRRGWDIRYGENYLWKRIWLILIGSIIRFESFCEDM